jgi:DNA-binding CsgD family transcriptional regulator/PAS domain-containing protein
MPEPVDLLPQLYEAASDPAQWSGFLESLSRRLNARVALLKSWSENSSGCALVHSGFAAQALQQYLDYYWSVDVLAKVVPQRGFTELCSVAPAEAFISDRELLGTEYANDFLLKFDLFRHCFAHLGVGETSSVLSVVRGITERPFEDAEMQTLRFLAPHILQALRLGTQFQALKASTQQKQAALDQLEMGVVFLSPTRIVLSMNESAESILRDNDGLLLRQGRLRAVFPDDDRKLQSLISNACKVVHARGTDPGGAMLMSRLRSRDQLKVIVGTACTQVAGLSSMPAAVVFIHDLARSMRPKAEILSSLYGLTPAECRIASLVLEGKSAEEITALLGITRNTLKTQMKSLFSKTEVRRQTDLVRKLMH